LKKKINIGFMGCNAVWTYLVGANVSEEHTVSIFWDEKYSTETVVFASSTDMVKLEVVTATRECW
jgi:hypothetical protein